MRVLMPDECAEAWEALKRRYPWLFDRENIGHSCPPGWLPTVERLCAQLDDALSDEERECVWLSQVKEKYGGLRAYLNVAPLRLDFSSPGGLVSGSIDTREADNGERKLYERLRNIVTRAEDESLTVCQWCGLKPASQRNVAGWLTTACARHATLDYRTWEDIE